MSIKERNEKSQGADSSTIYGVIITAIITILAATQLWAYSERQIYLDALPEKIAVSKIVGAGYQWGGRESCGAVVYELEEATADRIKAEGATFFTSPIKARGNNSNDTRFDHWNWLPGPVPRFPEDSRGIALAVGLGCAKLGSDIKSRFARLYSDESAFYSITSGEITVVMPNEGLVVRGYH